MTDYRLYGSGLRVRPALASVIAIALVTMSGTRALADDTPSTHRNAVSFTVGIATPSSGGDRFSDLRRFVDFGGGRGSSAGGMLGGTILRDLTDRVSVEFLGGYLDRGRTHGVTGMGQFLVNLTDKGKMIPYVSAGGGAYRTTRDDDLVVIQPLPNPVVVRQGRRIIVNPSPPSTTTLSRHSTDPALSLGGGLRLDLGPRFFARPDARLMMVMRDGQNELFGLFTFDVGLRF
jgi:hypothetical protein